MSKGNHPDSWIPFGVAAILAAIGLVVFMVVTFKCVVPIMADMSIRNMQILVIEPLLDGLRRRPAHITEQKERKLFAPHPKCDLELAGTPRTVSTSGSYLTATVPMANLFYIWNWKDPQATERSGFTLDGEIALVSDSRVLERVRLGYWDFLVLLGRFSDPQIPERAKQEHEFVTKYKYLQAVSGVEFSPRPEGSAYYHPTPVLIRDLNGNNAEVVWNPTAPWEGSHIADDTWGSSFNGRYVSFWFREQIGSANYDTLGTRIGVYDAEAKRIEWPCIVRADSVTGHNLRVSQVKVADDGEHVAVAGNNGMGGWIGVVSISKGSLLWEKRRLRRDSVGVDVCGISPDGKETYAGSMAGHVVCFDSATGSEIATWNAGERVTEIAPSPDGILVAVGTGPRGTVLLLNNKRQTEVARFDPGVGKTTGLAFSPDGSLLAVSGVHNRIRIYDVALVIQGASSK